MAKSGISLLCRQRVAQSERSHLPFTLDMIHRYRDNYGNRDIRRHGIHTAMMVAYVLLLRIPEYAPSKSNHHFRTQDVGFVTTGGIIPSYRCRGIDWEEITGVVFTVRSAKNDIEGEGHRMAFSKKVSGRDCICAITWAWARRARSQEHEVFFSSTEAGWIISPTHMSEALQAVAAAMNLPRHRYSPHSLRYGGASALAASGAPTYVIQTVGRWKSLAFLQYIKLSRVILDKVHLAITADDVLTAEKQRDS
jgi:hypothetical protein